MVATFPEHAQEEVGLAPAVGRARQHVLDRVGVRQDVPLEQAAERVTTDEVAHLLPAREVVAELIPRDLGPAPEEEAAGGVRDLARHRGRGSGRPARTGHVVSVEVRPR